MERSKLALLTPTPGDIISTQTLASCVIVLSADMKLNILHAWVVP